MPKFHLLYFKNLLDIAFIKFFELYGNKFAKIDNSYVLSQTVNLTKLKSIFKLIIKDELKKFIKPYDVLNPDYYIIIGACMPKDNFLLQFKDDSYFPEKLSKFIRGKYDIKYALKENDIQIDVVKFNQACMDVFLQFFAGDSVKRIFGKEFEKNVIFIQHKNLDCYSMFKIIKNIYGSANCINEKLERYSNVQTPIIAINDLIDKYIHNKKIANKSKEFIEFVEEIRQFLEQKRQHG